jgi:hypothetical protein
MHEKYARLYAQGSALPELRQADAAASQNIAV